MDKEILDGFKDESTLLLSELSEILVELERPKKEFPKQSLEDFSQRIDRIMGAAKTLSMIEPDHPGFKRIGILAELCKTLGYRASEAGKSTLIPIYSAFWADTIEVIEELLRSLEDPEESNKIAQAFSAVLQGRLEWLSKKVTQITGQARASAAQAEIDALLKELGV